MIENINPTFYGYYTIEGSIQEKKNKIKGNVGIYRILLLQYER